MSYKKPLQIICLIGLSICVTGAILYCNVFYYNSINSNTQVQVEASEKPDYFFFVHMTAPTSNPVRMQYAQLMEGELPKIGIGAELDLIGWAGGIRPSPEVGTYKEGGYDTTFFGMTLGTPAGHPGDSLKTVYGAEAIPPAGFNIMLWSPETGKNYNNYRAQESEELIQKITSNLDPISAKKDFVEWQKLWYDVMPNVLIYNQYEVHAVSAGLYGYDPVKYPLNSIEDVWLTSDYIGTADQIVLAASTAGDSFNPLIATDFYDHYSCNPVFDGLVENTPSREVVLPPGIDYSSWMYGRYFTTDYMALYPRIAQKIGSFSPNGLEYDIDVRKGVYWHDGHELDAWDVAFSQQAHLIPAIDSFSFAQNIIPFGLDDKTNCHGNYSFTVTDENNDSFFEHIKFTLNQTFAPFETECLGAFLFPEHILGDPIDHGFDSNGDFAPKEKWNVKPEEWQYHSTSTGQKTDPGGYAGPIGCGSMIFKDYDLITGTVTFQKFEDIKWDNTTSQWVSAPDISHWNIVNLDDMPDTVEIIVTSMDSALSELKSGIVNIMDPQFTLANILEELQTDDTIRTILSPENSWQAMYFNPKYVQDEVYHFQKKGVRHAISHIIPREKIITDLMNGLGCPAYTPLPVTSWAAISESELINYKKTLLATDNTTPESNAATAYDEYSIEKAFDWLDTEGYDTTEWRKYTEVTTTTSTKGLTPGFEFLIVVVLIVFLSIRSILKRKKV